MRRNSPFRRLLACLMILNLTLLGVPQGALAGAIGTEALLQAEARAAAVERVQSLLAREDVRAMLEARGVAPEAAAERVAALSDAELVRVQQQMDELPAGGILALIGAVFVVLLVLELVGVTNVFSKI